MIAKANDNCTAADEPDENCWKRSVSISSFLNGPFDTPKQDPQRGSHDLRLFKPGKVGKSLQDLAVSLSQPDCGLLQLRWIAHDTGGEAIQMPNCVASVWRRRNLA